MRFPFNLRADTAYDVVGFGTNAVDHLIRVPSFPQFGSKLEYLEHSLEVGGEVASTMVALSRLGMRTAYVGRFGSDEEGELGHSSLVREGVDDSYTEVVKGARSQVAFIVIDELSGERTIMWNRDERLRYTGAEAPVAMAGRGRLLHMTPHDTEACITMAKAAREAGSVVSLDIDNTFDGIEKLLSLVDICIASAEFPETFLGITDTKIALRQVAERFGCAVSGLTLGKAGSIVFCENEFIETLGFDVPGGCVDTTGAGDAFRTGFLYGVLKGFSVQESAIAANAVAALKCRGLGARSTLPDERELMGFIETA